METGDPGPVGPPVPKLAEVVPEQGRELVLIQPLKMVAVHAKDPTDRRQIVTDNSAQVKS